MGEWVKKRRDKRRKGNKEPRNTKKELKMEGKGERNEMGARKEKRQGR